MDAVLFSAEPFQPNMEVFQDWVDGFKGAHAALWLAACCVPAHPCCLLHRHLPPGLPRLDSTLTPCCTLLLGPLCCGLCSLHCGLPLFPSPPPQVY
jgi:hypothetical protein